MELNHRLRHLSPVFFANFQDLSKENNSTRGKEVSWIFLQGEDDEQPTRIHAHTSHNAL